MLNSAVLLIGPVIFLYIFIVRRVVLSARKWQRFLQQLHIFFQFYFNLVHKTFCIYTTKIGSNMFVIQDMQHELILNNSVFLTSLATY